MHNEIKKANKHRTATTIYPCFLPDLGDSTGAGRTRLPMQRKWNLLQFQR